MAEKKSFLLYIDRRRELELLSDEQAGQFIKAAYQYADTGVMPDVLDTAVKMMLSIVATQIDDATERWEQVKKKRSEAGRRSGEARRNKAKQSGTKRTNVQAVEQDETKRTVTVTVSNSTDSTVTYTQDCIAAGAAAQPAQSENGFIPLSEVADRELI